MDLQDIRKIVEMMDEHGLTHFDLSKKDFHLKLKKGADVDDLRALLSHLPAAAPAAPVVPHPAGAAPAPAAAPDPVAAPAGSEITSPMVGTLYIRRAPDAPALVQVGDTIAVGQTLCIIEAMKVMNEIKAEKAGTITAVLAEDGAPVQFGDVLFVIQ